MALRTYLKLFVVGAGLVSSAASWANELKGVRIWPAPDETRVVLDLQNKADYSHFSLAGPSRLVVDLKDTKIKTKLPVVVKDSDILTKVRKSTAPEKGATRLVFEIKRGVTPKIFSLAPTPNGSYGYRLVLDLPNGNAKTVGATEEKEEAKATANNQAKMPSGTADIVVAVDAGHGGDDPGSIGPTRKYEKNVTLAVAKKLAAKINATTGMRAVLTRRGDYFVPLGKRSEIARKNKALLLVSIHADGFTKPQPRGASVWVLNTRRANTEIGRWLEQSEKQSELLGGGDVLSNNTKDKYLGRAVLDLQFSYSQKEGYDVATRVLHELRKVARLHKTAPQYASLAVLKSPDIPSLLVETGFITNPTEERLLNTTSHQNQLANAVYKGVLQYFEANPPEGTLFASRLKGRGSKHKVTSGQSLSGIAQKYGVSMASIKAANHLKSNSVNIGQVLIIPGNIKTASTSTPTKVVSTSSRSTVKPVASTKVIVHKVVRGEYLGKIAAKYGVTMSSIRQLNHLKSDNVMLGQKLKIAVAAPKYVHHKVKRGEFLSKIADKYGVSVATIRATNKLRSDKLAVGQTLIIPRS
ncbi:MULTISPECIES: LysM peptidoglycan-binding domain-containing protein [unclassified Photobacterium]|uniref:LysM peptidoglycan-binding domain-containing protein n=1 Tax=unclassified Photobacterium TaxID=2628852 RepID=UPI001EE0500E|nr:MULTISPECIES: LysM peptidoglycan-binding domain-containing protein [unclassified Photobacterium]MCG3865927.1 N-acetylmuramoyl-L-alanine amidase [Photobacterium sp. Ph6]MCG3877383.1 N-acetylmuramoyl-L-alanine amidase [Photobacterium sp. Ph5]